MVVQHKLSWDLSLIPSHLFSDYAPRMNARSDVEPELLPCPFCGGGAEFVATQRRYDFMAAVECQSCGANTGPAGITRDEVVLRWNRRASTTVTADSDVSTLDLDKLDDAVLAILSLCIINDEIAERPGIQAEDGFDYESLVRLHKKGYLATEPHPPIHAIWLTPEGARRGRELFRKLFSSDRI
jgi:Lar family restriction alleviation protein